MDGLDDIVEEFLVESHENLDQLDQDLVALEQDPRSRDRLDGRGRGGSGGGVLHRRADLRDDG